MEIKGKKKEIINALAVGGTMSGISKTIPILDYAKIRVKGDIMIVSSFSGDVAIARKCKLENQSSENEKSFLVVAKDLISLLKTLRDDDVTLVANFDKNNITISHKKGEMSLPIQDANDFPVIENGVDAEQFELPLGTLLEWLQRGKSFIIQDELRPIMASIYLYIKDNEFGCCVTDANRLFHDYVPYNSDIAQDATITHKAINSLISLLNDSQNEDIVKMAVDSKNISFTTQNGKLTCRKLEGKYPNFKAVIPQNSENVVTIDKDELLDSIMRASLTTSASNCLEINLQGQTLDIRGIDADFGKCSREQCLCNHTGDDIRIGAKGVFFIDCVNAIISNEIKLEFSTSSRPIVLYDKEYPNKRIILMPMGLA